ncbi:hypothetical protein LAh8_81 [Aeromonas phage LAh_8]|uniref:Uncharacterized protein n=2 Tax=Lahexavirus TaxID=2843411 RepID=A0A513ZZS9_9CAUD|nr:hypothetical protein HWC30_gp023 [Aeromonas phage LAh_6]YP_009847420.1 hypothetical protein HWC31_gp082 [Aeromonas phage LAh_8]QDH46513.1 hypothetical protein LAh6_23 [Aeromonas phage LAh_6]QDH46748.1 hypothetical protein LAh8_81 [Aeromonas phage LAh_8]
MANFFKGLEGILKHPINEAKWMWDETKNVGKPLLKGDIGESWDQFTGSFGRHQDMMSDTITTPLGGHNKLTENSDAVAGAIIGGILAAPAMAAGGGSAAGGGAGGAGGGFAGFSGAPATATGGWGGGAQLSLGSSAYAPSTAFGQSAAAAAPSVSAPGAFGATAYTPTTAFGQAAAAGGGQLGGGATTAAKTFDWGKFAQMAQNLQTPEKQQQPVSMGAPQGGRWSGFDSKLYRNPLLEKEYMRVYTEPTYKGVK